MQASLALTQYFPTAGIFPSQGGGSTSFFLGEIGTFAGNFVPAGVGSSGQLLSINQNTAIFSLVGTYYGGDGLSNFALPNLNGTTMVGTGQGPGLAAESTGEKSGSATVTLNYTQTPANNLNVWGQSQAFDNHQPSLGITYEIATQGVFPSQGGGGSTPLNTLGMVMAFAGNFEAGGYLKCDGRLLSIAQNTALFSLLGTTYGGDGLTTFALPDLRGRDIIGASATDPVGTVVGQEKVTLTNSQVPNNGATTPFDNRQPSLAMQYVIALQGIFPTQGGNQDPTTPFLGQIVSFAANFVPSGWAKCDGDRKSVV
jgi:microcystin-dependent protein